MPTAALYVRVSTDRQETKNQLPDLQRLVAARGWEPVLYEETEGGARRLPVLERLLADAKAGKVGVIVVWALDRLSRQGAGPVLNMVAELDRVGVALVSIREPWLDTSGPFRDVLVAFAATMAKLERARLVERTRAGIERARREGKKLGRPRTSPLKLAAGAQRVQAGASIRAAAKAAGVGAETLRRYLARAA
jgi:DNA invertase Pin-like site-specific DNA recombinase